MSIKLITPSEVDDVKTAKIPDAVFEAFNEMIAEEWDGHQSIVKQPDVMPRVLEKLKPTHPEITRQKVFDKKWLDVEHFFRKAGWKVEYHFFRKAGWKVEYDKGAYYDTYDPYFTFEKGRKKKKKQPCGEGC